MHHTLRIVTDMPLAELWSEHGPLHAERVRLLTKEELIALLQVAPVEWVIADVGHQLRWIPLADCFATWKRDVRAHVVDDPTQPIVLDHYPDGYAYVASEWQRDDPAAPPIVVLERHH